MPDHQAPIGLLPDVGIQIDPIGWDGVLWGAFVHAIGKRDLRYLQEQSLILDPARGMPGTVGTTILEHHDGTGHTQIFELAGGVVGLLRCSPIDASIVIAAQSELAAEAAIDTVRNLAGTHRAPSDEVPVNFWTNTQHGPYDTLRRIAAPSWDEIASNYTRATNEAVRDLLASAVPDSGRLLLWHGEPGTGKTHALRALARAWQHWCETHVVTDPEELLGAGSAYLMEVLTHRRHRDRRPWKLIVLEDAGELLTADARERAGQALSRLLNVTDGIMGQGLNAITLVTTNEPLGRLHPAVSRPGRCWKQIEFSALSAAESNIWLEHHDSPDRITSPASLAQLYAKLRGEHPSIAPPVGFR